jgi:hypothetical protein
MRRSARREFSRRLASIPSPRSLASRAFVSPFASRRATRRFAPLGWLALGAGLASVGMALLDPSRGAARRALLRDKGSSGLRRLREGTRGRLVHARSRAKGALHELRARFAKGEVSDATLEERVRSQLGRSVSHPGALRVSALAGCVEISGPVLAEEADDLIDSIRGVRGVKDVVDRLDLHDFAGSEPALQGEGPRPSL